MTLMARKNCWEATGCGRESGGSQAGTLGVCPAARTDGFDGVNRGERAGRFCWAIAGTFCGGKIGGTFAAKLLDCLDCGFLQRVRDEEGNGFIMTPGDAEEGSVRAEDTVLQRTTAIAKRVLVFMGQNGIPVTPRNYTVWFEYHYGSHEALEQDVNEHKMRGTPLNTELTEHFYNRYFGDQDRQRLHELVEEQTGKILKGVIESVLATANNTTEYGKKLRRYSRTLSGVDSSQDVKRIIKNIISDTKEMETSNAGLWKELENIALEADNLKKQIEQKEKDLLRDPLTGLGNRRALTQRLQGLYDEFVGSGAVFSIIMCDIDSFKQFNDQYGHMIGDEALQIVSATLEENVKGKDFVGRYGGDEFILLLPMTPLYSASIVASHLSRSVAEKKLKLKNSGSPIEPLGISLGVSQIRAGDSVEAVLKRADESLSLSKRTKPGSVKTEKDLHAE